MALPKKQLREKLENLTPENIKETMEWILDGNSASLEALREERDTYKEKADAADQLARERDDYKAKYESAGDAAKVQADFDAYKQQVEDEKANAAKSSAVRKVLKDSGVQREEFLELLMGKVDLSAVEMDGDAIKNAETLVAPLRASYAGCFAALSDEGTKPQNPPSGGGTRMTKEQIAKIENREERRAAIAANLDLYN